MKNKIFFVLILCFIFIFSINVAFANQPYRWFEEETIVYTNKFFSHFEKEEGDKLSPVKLTCSYGTYFRLEGDCKVEIYKAPKSWREIAPNFSEHAEYLMMVIDSEKICPLLEEGEYIFKVSGGSGEILTFVFGPRSKP
jgi:hypothetical protein